MAKRASLKTKPKVTTSGPGLTAADRERLGGAIDRGIDRALAGFMEQLMQMIRGHVIDAIRAERRDGKGAGLALIDARHAIIKASRKDKLGVD
jgi:hypothetical protein